MKSKGYFQHSPKIYDLHRTQKHEAPELWQEFTGRIALRIAKQSLDWLFLTMAPPSGKAGDRDMGRPISAAGTDFLRLARNAIRRDPQLRGALRDPDMIAAADLVISTMRQAGSIPTALNMLAHLTDHGMDGKRAAILAAIAETRLNAASS